MGTWGTGIFENDWAADIRDDYNIALKYSTDDEDALRIFIEEHKEELDDTDDGPITWLVLAQSMWKKGRLTEYVYEKAKQAAADDLKNWEYTSPKDYEKRRKNLDKFIAALSEPQPAAKPIKRVPPFKCDWKKGDVFLWNDGGTVFFNINEKRYYFQGCCLAVIFDEMIEYCGLKCVKFYLKFCENAELTLDEIKALPYIKYVKWIRNNPDSHEELHCEDWYGTRMAVDGEGKFVTDFYSFATVIKGMDFVKKLNYVGNLGENSFPKSYDDSVVEYHILEQLFGFAVKSYGNCNRGYCNTIYIDKHNTKNRDYSEYIQALEY